MTMPNVLWISTHDINPHLGCYAGIWPGAEQATTPTLDRLAADGLRFDKAMATAPVCAPARSSIMTGQFTTAIGTMHMRTSAVPPDETVLLPQLFRAAGYHTTNNWFTDFQMEIPNPVFDACSTRAHWRDRLPGQSTSTSTTSSNNCPVTSASRATRSRSNWPARPDATTVAPSA